ncbi:MAG: phosphoenolpyruvate--protein phosphotransferase [Ignavibacteriales bacterium]|nr:phosphoenolpyruvate--protein phosphotransferase [Ignavibacteriales bacterium]
MSIQSEKPEIVLHGIPASHGISMGSAYLFLKDSPVVEERFLNRDEVLLEHERLNRSLEKSSKELRKILAFAQEKIGEAKARVLDAQIMVLEDPVLIDSIKKRIDKEKKNAEFIVNDEIGKYASLMLKANDEYMHERAHDMEDLKNRIVRNLLQERLISKIDGSIIVVAHTLTPADTMILSSNQVLGYATDRGGITSHAALFSRAMKIPAIVGLGDVSRYVSSGNQLIIDGYSGTLIIHPSDQHIKEYEQKRDRMLKFEQQLSSLKDLPAETKDGHKVELSANIELLDELEYVVVQGSQGIGLYRTESLLLGRDDFPSEQEQYEEYKKIVDRIYPHRVIMRTFDIGGDKVAPATANETNPFLGWRGIRISLDKPVLFMNQLRAMLRAGARKNLSIMFPMVATIEEVLLAKQYVRKVKAELRAEGIKFYEKTPIGVMIEVPSAALMISRIASEVDFVSIGTNDLTQYLLAVDRGNTLVSKLYKQFHPSVINTLKHIVNGAHKQNIWAGICGEMAGHPLAAPLLVGLGIDELSVVPAVLPEIKKIIRSLNYSEMQELATNALHAETNEELEKILMKFFKKNLHDIPLDSL